MDLARICVQNLELVVPTESGDGHLVLARLAVPGLEGDPAAVVRPAEVPVDVAVSRGVVAGEEHADSPELVLARDKDLELTEQQRTQLEKILETARNKTREMLTDQQREQLEQAPEGPLSMMQIAMLLKKDQANEEESGPMCPMCMKMMKENTRRRQQKPGQ